MAIKLENKTNVQSPDSDYPYGRIKDNPGDGTGTPVNELVYGDFHQFLSRLFDKSRLTYNNLPDNDYSGFQFFEALEEAIFKFKEIVFYTDNASLNDESYGKLNIMNVNGNKTLTLPESNSFNEEKRILILKLGTGTLTVSPFSGQAVVPSQTLTLLEKDSIELVSHNSIEHIIINNNIKPPIYNPAAATNTLQSSLSGPTDVIYGTEVSDPDNFLDISTGEFIPKVGLHKLLFSCTILSEPAVTDISLSLYKNGSSLAVLQKNNFYGAAGEDHGFSIVYPINANGTDVYKLVVENGSTGIDIKDVAIIIEPFNKILLST
jgi:hypothetical protein